MVGVRKGRRRRSDEGSKMWLEERSEIGTTFRFALGSADHFSMESDPELRFGRGEGEKRRKKFGS